jgi:hypothetical protein
MMHILYIFLLKNLGASNLFFLKTHIQKLDALNLSAAYIQSNTVITFVLIQKKPSTTAKRNEEPSKETKLINETMGHIITMIYDRSQARRWMEESEIKWPVHA